MTFKINYDYKNCYLLLIDGNDLLTKMPSYSQRFRAKPRLDSWLAPNASFYASENYEGETKQLPDITIWAIGNLVLSPKAYEVFKDTLTPSGEFLPLIIGEDTYYMFNTLFVIPEEGIDRSHEIEVMDSGVHMGQGNVLFKEAALDGHHLFKTPTDKLRASYCTGTFKALYEKNTLRGLVFEEVAVN